MKTPRVPPVFNTPPLSSRQIISVLVCLTVQFGSAAATAVRAGEPATADLASPADAAPAAHDRRDVIFHKIKANRILFLGNSITLHGPAPAIGWLGNWGMAASSKENDYVHLMLKAITQTAGKEPQSLVANAASFERQYETYDIDSGLKRELAFQADLIIVAIGENVPALTSEQAKAKFLASMTKLLKKLQADGNPVIVVRTCFWPDRAKDTILKQACGEVGGIFVDTSTLGKVEANYARSERQFSHAGVAAHPGDRGMKAIADAILEALRKRC